MNDVIVLVSVCLVASALGWCSGALSVVYAADKAARARGLRLQVAVAFPWFAQVQLHEDSERS